jgi:WD40 repeat protein
LFACSLVQALDDSDDDKEDAKDEERNSTYGSKDGLTLLVGDSTGKIKLWSARTAKATHVIESFSNTLLYQPPGRIVMIGTADGTLKSYQLGNRNGALLEEDTSTRSGSDTGHRRYNREREPKRDHDAIGARFELGSRQVEGQTHELKGHFSTAITSTAMAGAAACTGGGDGQIKLWDLARQRDTGTLTGHSEAVVGLHLSSDNATCTSASLDCKIKCWAIQPPCEDQELSSEEEEEEDEDDGEDGEEFEDEDDDDPDAEEDEVEEEEGIEQERYDEQLRAEHATHPLAVQMIVPAQKFGGSAGRRGAKHKPASSGCRPISTAKRAALEGPLGAGRSRRAAMHRTREQARHENQRMMLTVVSNEIHIWGDMTRQVPQLGLRGRAAWLAEKAEKKSIRERLAVSKALVRAGKIQGGSGAAIPPLLHKPCETIKETDPVLALALMPDNSAVLLGVRKDIKIWTLAIDDAGCKLISTLGGANIYGRGHGSFVVAIAVSADGEWVASGEQQGVVKLWNMEYAYCVKTFKVHKCSLSALQIDCSSIVVVSDNLDKNEVCWDSVTGENTLVNDDGVIIAADVEGGLVTLACDMPKRNEEQDFWHPRTVLAGHRHGIVQVVAAGGLIASGDATGLVKLWSMASGVMVRRLHLGGKLCNLQLVPTEGCSVRRLGAEDDEDADEEEQANASNNAPKEELDTATGATTWEQKEDSDSDDDVTTGHWHKGEGDGYMLMTCTTSEVRLWDCSKGRFDVLMSMPSLEPLQCCALVPAAPPPTHTNVEDEERKAVHGAHELAFGTFTGRVAMGRINWHHPGT